MPACRILPTAAQASASRGNAANAVNCAAGLGISRTVTSVTTPSVPSDPMKSRLRSYPATSLIVRPPRRSTCPPASTTSNPRT